VHTTSELADNTSSIATNGRDDRLAARVIMPKHLANRELLIDCVEDRTPPAVFVGLLREAG
jgi:hypothetical protein